jgi:hypothetical protein
MQIVTKNIYLSYFKKKTKLTIQATLSVIFATTCSMSSMAADIFVATNGSDAQTGTLANPLASIQQALNKAVPGDIIYLREGRYHGYVDFAGINGASGQPITISGYNGERAVIDGSRLLSDIGGTTWEPLTDAGHPNCADHCFKTTIDTNLIDDFDFATDSEDGSKVKGIWQLWFAEDDADGSYKMMIPARWPNYDLSTGHPTKEIEFKKDNRTPIDGSWWDMGATWGFMKNNWVDQKVDGYDSSVLTSKDLGYNLHKLENNSAYQDLADLPAQDQGGNELNFSGGSLVLNYHSETQFSRQIEPDGHSAGSNKITHRSVVDPHDQNAGYFLVEHKNALDQPGEWYFDKETKEVWLWPEDEQNPTGKNIRGKTQSWAMDLNGSKYITLSNLEFFGTTIKCETSCENITIEDSRFFYPSWYPRMLGLHSYKGEENLTKGDKAGSDSGEGSTRLKGSNYLIKNNVFAHSDAMIDMNGSNNCGMRDNHVINNLFHHWSYTGLSQMVIIMNSNCDSTFTRNTMHTNGSKVMAKHGSVDVSWSHVSSFGYFQQDGTAFQCKGGNFEDGASNGTERHHIWAVDALKGLGRWDGNDGVGGIDHHQVAMNVAAHGNIKGDYHTISNNTTVFPHQSSKSMFKISSTTFAEADSEGIIHPDENENSYVYNNLSSGMSSDPHSAMPLLVKQENQVANWNGFGVVSEQPNLDTNIGPFSRGAFTSRSASDTVASRLRDPENFDFRPEATATDIVDKGEPVIIPIVDMNGIAVPKVGAIDSEVNLDDPIAGAKADLGAYEYDIDNSLEYWIPGFRHQYEAAMPVPRNKTDSAKGDADLMWLPAREAVGHIVYLGGNANQLNEECRFEGANAAAEGRNISNLPNIEVGFTHLRNICTPSFLNSNTHYYWRVDTFLADGSVKQGDLWAVNVAIPAIEVTTVIEPIADTFIDAGKPSDIYDNVEGLKICTPDSDSNSNLRIAYFKFDLANIDGSIKKATLRVRRNDQSGTSNDTGAYIVPHNWVSDELDYDKAVELALIPEEGSGDELAFVDKIYQASWGDFDITEGLEPGQTEVAIALKSHPSASCGNKKLIDSIEAEHKANAEIGPELVIISQEEIGDIPPRAVQNLMSLQGLQTVTLTWDITAENDVIGYNIYRRDHHEDEYKFPLNQQPLSLEKTVFTDTSLTVGQSYEYIVRAIDAADQESEDTEITAVSLPDSNNNGISDFWENFYASVTPPDQQDLAFDSDHDDMSDEWEVTFGLDARTDDANGDLDDDGFSNIEEYLAGTNPTVKNAMNPEEPTDPEEPEEPEEPVTVIIDDNENVTSLEDTLVTGNLLDNASSSDGILSVSSYTIDGVIFDVGTTAELTEGQLTINADGNYNFVPKENYNGAVSVVTYTAINGANDIVTSTLTINITPVIDIIDNNENMTTLQDTTLSGNVLDNASSPDGPLSVTSYTVDNVIFDVGSKAELTEGDLTLNADGSFTFIPSVSFNGAVPLISYTIIDGADDTITSTLTIDITPVEPTSPEKTESSGGSFGAGFLLLLIFLRFNKKKFNNHS